MKIIIAFIIFFALMAASGVGALHYFGYDILSREIWTLGARSLYETPMEVWEEIASGQNQELFVSITVAIVGACCVAALMMITNLLVLVGWARKLLRRFGAGKKPRQQGGKKDRREESLGSPAPAPRSKPRMRNPFAGLAGKIRKARRDAFKDDIAVLDAAPRKEKSSLLDRLSSWVGSLRKTRTDEVVISSDSKNEAAVKVYGRDEFKADLGEWYGNIRNVSKDDPEMIERAKVLSGKARQSLRDFVVEADPMNGEFKLRMLDAWAAKIPGGGAERGIPDDAMHEESSVLLRAVREVEAEDWVHVASPSGVVDEESFEDDIGAETATVTAEEVDIDEDQDVGEDGGVEQGVEAEDVDLPDDDDGSEDMPNSLAIAASMKSFENLGDEVVRGEAEWPEDLSDPEARSEAVQGMMSRFEEALVDDETSGVDFEIYRDEDEALVDWIDEAKGDLAALRRRLMEIASGSGDEAEADPDDDLEAQFSGYQEDVGGAEEETADALGGDVSEEAAEVASDAQEDHGSGNEIGAAGVTDEQQEEDAPEVSAGEVTDPEASSSEAPRADLEPDTHGNLTEDKDAVAREDGPRNMTIQNTLEEVERSGSITYQWGVAARSAGAAEARLCHPIFAKEGVNRRVVGIIHLVARWRDNEGDEGRLVNIILRCLPEGQWSLDETAENPRMIDEKGNFVEVDRELVEHPEIRRETLIVHFYGPGAPSGVRRTSGGQLITSEILSVEEIEGILPNKA